MRHILRRLLGRNQAAGTARPAGRRKAPVRLGVESLEDRALLSGSALTSSIAPHVGIGGSVQPILVFQGPNLAGKSVELIAQTDRGPLDVGTVHIDAESPITGRFTGTYRSYLSRHLDFFGETYDMSLDAGPVPITGQVGAWRLTIGAGWTSVLTLTGSLSGQVLERHHYFFDDPANPNDPRTGMPIDESWSVPDSQSVSFTGTVTQTGGTYALTGTAVQTDIVDAQIGLDHLAGSNHRTTTGRFNFQTTAGITGTFV
jgi:hypothetical protein